MVCECVSIKIYKKDGINNDTSETRYSDEKKT